jgi:Lipocalin-like domain
MLKAVVLTAAVVAVAGSGHLIAQKRDSVVGTWKLVSASASTADGNKNDGAFGSNPTGALTYTPEGRMILIISYSGRKPLSGADRIAAPPAERAEAFATSFAYAGRYSLSGDKVVHHVEVATVQNWVNTDLVRLLKLEGNRMTLQTPPLSVDGVIQTSELVWQRIE